MPELGQSHRAVPWLAGAGQAVRTVLNTTVDDGYIKRNLCRLTGAGSTELRNAVERVYSLAEQMPDRLRVLIVSAAFTGLRRGELIALCRCDVDLTAGVLHVPLAGVRDVALPTFLVVELAVHLDALQRMDQTD